MTLIHHPCQSRCSWHPTGEFRDALPLFGCSGCGSQWTPEQRWTPVNVDGKISPEVEAAKQRYPS